MELNEIQTHADWLVAVTEAFKDGDDSALYELKAKAEGWLQPANETEAQVGLIAILLEALEALWEGGNDPKLTGDFEV
jgi:hypothetical protein